MGTNEYQPIELEWRSQTVLEFESPKYVNAFLKQASIGNYTPQRKSNSGNIYVTCAQIGLKNSKSSLQKFT